MMIYFLRPVGMDGPVKIGMSANPEDRLQTYNRHSPFELEIVATIPGSRQLEMRFHAFAADHWTHHEWFAAHEALTKLIEEVRGGSFNVDTLPAPRNMQPDRVYPEERRRWMSAITKLRWARDRNELPPEMAKYGAYPPHSALEEIEAFFARRAA